MKYGNTIFLVIFLNALFWSLMVWATGIFLPFLILGLILGCSWGVFGEYICEWFMKGSK